MVNESIYVFTAIKLHSFATTSDLLRTTPFQAIFDQARKNLKLMEADIRVQQLTSHRLLTV